jgi:hypothetical protein
VSDRRHPQDHLAVALAGAAQAVENVRLEPNQPLAVSVRFTSKPTELESMAAMGWVREDR